MVNNATTEGDILLVNYFEIQTVNRSRELQGKMRKWQERNEIYEKVMDWGSILLPSNMATTSAC